ncbi:MAG: formate dehydrogenase-N subunit alpha [Methylobacterium sp.]|nr:MAG: formate dehydrogenase-N subunit alpha [Methylobacterium sp.]
MTNLWMDIKHADVITVMGGNAAEAHPCGFKWVVEAKAHNNAKLIVVDPRFTRTASVADLYCPIRQGTDIAFLSGVAKYLLDNDKLQHRYVAAYSNAGYVVREGYDFQDGLFSGYDPEKRDYDKSTWDYEIGPDGYAVVDETMQHPRCVMQLLKKHVALYTPEMVSRICGSPQETFLKVCELIATTSTPDRTMASLYALGWTHHSKGSQNIRSMCIVQTLLGNIGMLGGGMQALRGHSNIQGLTDIGLMSNLIPGYLNIPIEKEPTYQSYAEKRQFKPLRPGQTSYWSNYNKFFVSFQKAMWGEKATKENDWAYDYLPKLDVPTYDVLRGFELAKQGKMTGYIIQGFNPLLSFPNRAKMTEAFSKMKFIVVMDPLKTETARFWENHGEYNDVDTASIQTEVFELPTTLFAEEEGSLSNSSRWLQWHWQAQDAPGECKPDIDIMAGIFLRMKEMYQKEGGAFPDAMLNLTWNYAIAHEPTPVELARELNGYTLAPTPGLDGQTLPAGRQVDGFAQLKDDGTTACGCWVYSGCYTEKGNTMARRDNTDPGDRGIAPNWAFAWPANRRVLYNRASCDPEGKPWSEKKKLIEWNGKQWVGFDVPDYGVTVAPDKGVGPFILNQEGVARLWTRGLMRDGPFPTHYEPFESPMANIPFPRVKGNPASRIFKDDLADLGTSEEFPYAATSYRLTEHFHGWTKHARINAILQPEAFVEISEQLAKEKGIVKGGWVRVWSKRGSLKAKAVVTKRIKPLMCDGKAVHVVGIPQHWGFMGQTKKGWHPNSLTPVVGDANTETPEFKAWLVNIEPTTPPSDAVA